MSNIEPKPNLVVVACGEPARISHILSEAKVEVQLIASRQKITVDIDDILFLPPTLREITEGEGVTLKEIPDGDNVSFDELTKAREIHLVIGRYLAKEILLPEALKLLSMKRSTFYRLIKNFDEAIGPLSLVPSKRGRAMGRKQFTDEMEKLISTAIDKVYKGKGTSFVKVWHEVRAQCTKLGLTPPSKNSVISRVKERGERELHRLKHGAESAAQKFGAKPGTLEVSAPLELVEIDHTRVDCMLCDKDDRKALSRPWVTLIIDVYTRVIVGYYIAFHAPSTLSVACAITHAVLPKKNYLEQLKCEHVQHPFYGVPKILHMDNAKEFRSLKLQKACALHGITPQYRPPGKKHYGAHVERLIGTMMTSHVHLLPGTTMSNAKDKGDYDSEAKATFTIDEFTQWFAGQVGIYNHTEHRMLGCTPADKWHKSFTDENGSPRYPTIISDQFSFRLDFMPEERRSIRPVGVELFGKKYWAPELKHCVGMKNVIIKYDPYSLYSIWAKIDNEYVQLRRSDLTSEDTTYEQHLITIACRASRKDNKMDRNIIIMRDSNEQLVSDCKKLTKQAKKRQEAARAYSAHTLNQHFKGNQTQASSTKALDIDFSAAPVIYSSEEL
ncbi:Mu transposase C-terminal domain-containing protein [Pseudomonas asiatica]|uniref:Mu transposase C-terminal domain-containing protein n=1 Tax=Pseudomonas asiatica TaxID=2219225 RepID=UPI002AC96EE1|nr:DDE-type integrase/transposase/recombinase [Pseudomonas asiatica]